MSNDRYSTNGLPTHQGDLNRAADAEALGKQHPTYGSNQTADGRNTTSNAFYGTK